MYYLVVTFSITYLKVHVHAEHQGHPAVAAGCACRALRRHPPGRASQRPIRQAPKSISFRHSAALLGPWGIFAFPMMNSVPTTRSSCRRSSLSGWSCTVCMYAPRSPGGHGKRCFRPECGIPESRWVIRSLPSWPVRWHPSLPSVCLESVQIGGAHPPLSLAATAVVSAVAVLAARETKGVDLATIDLRRRAVQGRRQTSVA